MVRDKLRTWTPPLTETLQPSFLQEVVSNLFPNGAEHQAPYVASSHIGQVDVPSISDAELSVAVLKLHGKKKAPGPDGIPGCVWALAVKTLGNRLRKLFDTCLETELFPACWKIGKLILLKKVGRPENSPAAYRPIVLLNEVDKLFERIIAGRLIKHLNAVGPNLSSRQYGFRAGRSTIDAILCVKNHALRTVSRGGVLLAVSLDIANAFNTLPWASIREALKFHKVPSYLSSIVEAYLSERYIEFPVSQGQTLRREMTCGVPQGSVLGPLLWNIGYDWILRSNLSPGASVVCYADDTLVMAQGKTFEKASDLATVSVDVIVGKIRQLGLKVALEKTEAICFHGPRKAPPGDSSILIGEIYVRVEPHLKYLGLILDSRWNFQAHFANLAPRLVKAASALKRILPNIGGPNTSCRRLYMGVVRSMALYGAPVWVDAMTEKIVAHLRRPQRMMAIGLIRGYRTISYEAACLLAGSPPWDLEAEVYAARYEWRMDIRLRGVHLTPGEESRWLDEAKRALLERWSRRLAHPRAGCWTVEAVRPYLREWLERQHGSLSFRLVQVLSGHGCFGKYLHRIAGREPTPACHHCGCVEDTAQHTLGECPAWTSERRILVEVVGNDLSLPAVVRAMVESGTSWTVVRSFCDKVMSLKEAAERERETSSTLPIRRRRVRRRERIPHALLQPP